MKHARCAAPGPRPRLDAARGLALLVCFTCPAALAAQEPPETRPRFPGQAELVVVDAVVRGPGGRLVAGLTAADFEVREDGRPQRILSFEAVALPESPSAPSPTRARVTTNVPAAPQQPSRAFVIVFDDVHMAPQRLVLARQAVDVFLHTGLSDGDEVTLVPASGGAWWTARMPEGRADLAAALERLQGRRSRNTRIDRVSDWEARQLHLHRDARVMAEVARRYYEHRLILEPPGIAERADAQLSPGLPMIQARAAEVYQAALQRKRATLGVLERVAESLARAKGRKSIVLVSEGFIHEPELPEFRDVVSAARRANAAFYFLDVRGLEGTPVTADAELSEGTDPRDLGSVLNETRLAAQGADSIAIDSGGFSVANTNDLAGGLSRIAEDSRSYYLLGYQPASAARDGKFHKIEVRVRRPGLQVRARRGYYAPEDGAATRHEPGALDPRVRQSLDSPYLDQGVPLRVAAYVLGPAGEGQTDVLLVAEADPRGFDFHEKQGRLEDALDSFVVVSSRDTGANVSQEKLVELSLPPEVKRQLEAAWLPLLRSFQLGPGVYQAHLLVRDRNSGRIGTVRHEFDVPPPDALRVTTPVFSDTAQPQPGGAPPRPVPLARRSFAAGRTLYYLFEVHGARRDSSSGASRVASGYRIESADGRVVVTEPEKALGAGPQGELSQLYVMSIRGLAPGAYTLVLTVLDELAAQRLEVRDPFEIAPPGRADAGPVDR